MSVLSPMIAYAILPSGSFDSNLLNESSNLELNMRFGIELPKSDRDLFAYLLILYANALNR